MRVRSARVARDVLVVGAATSAGAGASWATFQLLNAQARTARTLIPHRTDLAPRRDGIYTPGTDVVSRPGRVAPADVSLMVFGDSTAAGLGVDDPEWTPGVQIVRAVVEQTGKRVQLGTKAIVGATSRGLDSQVEAILIAGPAPDVAVIMIGANDVTAMNGVEASARRLGQVVRRLRRSGTVVVVGTCPDLGVVSAIPQPLRGVLRRVSARLAGRQRAHVLAAGGHPVPLGKVLAPEFLQAPDMFFSADNFHPSAAGYELAARLLVPAVIHAMDEAQVASAATD